MKKKVILSIGAHNDDHVIGAGGALIQFAREGFRVVTIVCSYGESSHPHLKADVITAMRKKECAQADKLMGGSGVVYLGVREGHFREDFAKPEVMNKVKEVLKKEDPVKIFTHDVDAHPDHNALHEIVMKLIDEGIIICPVYSFDIWSLVRLKNRNVPRLVVDTSDTFNTKVRAFLAHKSQKAAIVMLLWRMVLKDWISGLMYGYRYAEVFFRLR